MFGFINAYKEKGITSFDVIFRLRKALKIKKVGHAGTLDPLAEGVLPVAVGSATKLIEYLPSDKKYIAQIEFGKNSTTYDNEGEKTFIKEPDFTQNDFLNALDGFKGKIKQKPPIYSAIKIGGKKLYDIARSGGEVPEIQERDVEIYDIKLLNFNLPYVEIEVFCSSGTYIRSLAYDLGQKLDCGAYLAGLVRTMACGFDIKNCDNEKIINPIEALPFLVYELTENEYQKVKNGNKIKGEFKQGEKVLLSKKGALIAISTQIDDFLKVDKVFNV